MWAILDNLSTTDTEDVTIDAGANWKALRPMSAGINGMRNNLNASTSAGLGVGVGGGVGSVGNAIGPIDGDDSDAKRFSKVMSPGSTTLPTWDNAHQQMMMNGGGGGGIIGGPSIKVSSMDPFHEYIILIETYVCIFPERTDKRRFGHRQRQRY